MYKSAKISNIESHVDEIQPIKKYTLHEADDEKRLDEILNSAILENSHDSRKFEIEKLLETNMDVFHLKGDPWYCSKNLYEHEIITSSNKPVKARTYSCPHKLRPEMNERISE